MRFSAPVWRAFFTKASLIIATMASKFMANSAFRARLLLRPSRQRTGVFRTVYKLGCPIPSRSILPLILSSRSYSEFTPTPPLPKKSESTPTPPLPNRSESTPAPSIPKKSESTQGSQSSEYGDKNWFTRAAVGGALVTTSLVRAGFFLCAILKYADYQRVLSDMSLRKSG